MPAFHFDIKVLPAQGIITVKIIVWLLALWPFLALVYGVLTQQLGPNPVETLTRNTGWWTLVLLCVTLSVTPLRKTLKWPWLIRLRRLLGLFAFFYACLHFTTWLWFDHFFDLLSLLNDVVKRPFITVGFVAFVMLVPLALTSSNAMVRRLGGKRWQYLHRLVYLILPLGVLHFWWHKAGKNDFTEPIVFTLIVVLLLAIRVWWRWRT